MHKHACIDQTLLGCAVISLVLQLSWQTLNTIRVSTRTSRLFPAVADCHVIDTAARGRCQVTARICSH